jgi:nucleoside-diphosphate-sugar epimerase
VKLGIFGASGFVGSALCERLYFEREFDFTCFVRSTGNAGRIARLPVDIRRVDLLDRQNVADAMKSCDIAINCTMGSDWDMLKGIENLVAGAKAAKIRKFIHLSSIALYGQDPAPDSITEAGQPAPVDSYGRTKLQQDKAVLQLHRSGIPSYLLVPGNISGPYSRFMRGLTERLMAGPMPLVDGGRYACNLVHVDNVAEGLLAAVRTDSGGGERYFLNELEPVSWRQLYDDLATRLGAQWEYVDVARESIVKLLNPPAPSTGLAAHAKVLLSSNFRKAASKMPLFGWMNATAGELFRNLPADRQQRIRERVKWPIRIEKASSGPRLDETFVKVQARRFYHSSAHAQQRLGWRPVLSYEQGLDSRLERLVAAGIKRSLSFNNLRPSLVGHR